MSPWNLTIQLTLDHIDQPIIIFSPIVVPNLEFYIFKLKIAMTPLSSVRVGHDDDHICLEAPYRVNLSVFAFITFKFGYNENHNLHVVLKSVLSLQSNFNIIFIFLLSFIYFYFFILLSNNDFIFQWWDLKLVNRIEL